MNKMRPLCIIFAFALIASAISPLTVRGADGAPDQGPVTLGSGDTSGYYGALLLQIKNILLKVPGYDAAAYPAADDDGTGGVDIIDLLRVKSRTFLTVPVAAGEITGSWAVPDPNAGNSYDGDVDTVWNPNAGEGYGGQPGIIYTLDGYYDVDSIAFSFNGRPYYFDLFASMDGVNYTKHAQITAANQGDFYKGTVCFPGISGVQSVKYIKLVFTGSADGSTLVSLNEIAVTGNAVTVTAAPAEIIAHQISGTWAVDREGSASLGPQFSYDGVTETTGGKYWNPQAGAGYGGDPGIVYELAAPSNLNAATLVFLNRAHYFTLFVSADGVNWAAKSSVTAGNYTDYFTEMDGSPYDAGAESGVNKKCTLSFSSVRTRFIKLVFTGNRVADNTYVALREISLTKDNIAVVAPSVPSVITSHQISGAWALSREGDSSVGPQFSYDGVTEATGGKFWNPQAGAGYGGDPGIIYELASPSNLNTATLVFVNRAHYFNLFASADGVTWTRQFTVTAANYTNFFTEMDGSPYKTGIESGVNKKCTLTFSSARTRFVKIVFTGNRVAGNVFVALREISLTRDDAPVTVPAVPAAVQTHQISGAWALSRDGDPAIGPHLSYDGAVDAKLWNPQAGAGFSGDPGIIYELASPSDLRAAVLVFGSRAHYFNLFVSADGDHWTRQFTVTAANFANFFTEMDGSAYNTNAADKKCTLNFSSPQTKFVKLVFTGTINGTTFVGLREISLAKEAE